MSKYIIYLLVFGAGLCFAVVMALLAHQQRSGKNRSLARLEDKYTLRSSVGVSEKPTPVQSFILASDEEPSIPAAQLEILKEAIREGSIDSLQLIRTEHLSFIPEYRERVLKQLKQEALSELVSRFVDSDWSDWPNSGYVRHGLASKARTFVDDVSVVNPELGRFLETSALLLYGMYLSIMGGNVYSVEDGLLNVVAHAERLFPKRRSSAVPARLLLDLGVHQDPAFKRVFEKVRGDLVLQYSKRFPNELDTHLDLLLDLSPSYVSARVYDLLYRSIYRLALDTSLKYREEIFERLIRSKTVEEFSQRDEKIRQALAELYVIGAVDALEAGALERASGLLGVSEQLYHGLSAQNAVRAYLVALQKERRSAVGGEKRTKGGVAQSKSRSSVLGFSENVEAEFNESASVWSYVKHFLVLLLLIGLPAAVIARVIQGIIDRRTALLDAHTRSEIKSKSSVRITSPADIRFDDDEKLSEAVNR